MFADGRARRVVGWTGIALLGAALAYAPIAAFGDDMLTVSRLGIAGLAFVLVASRLPRPPEPAEPAREKDGSDALAPPPGSGGESGTTRRDEA